MHRSVPTALRSAVSALALALPLALASAACSVDVSIDDSGDGTVEASIDITGECSGTGSQTFDDGSVSSWVKTLHGDPDTGTCQIDVDWSGALVDMTDLRARAVEEQADHDFALEDVKITAVDLTIRSASFGNTAITFDRAELEDLDSQVDIGATAVFHVDRDTALPLEVSASPDLLAAANAAFQAGSTVDATATGLVMVPMPQIRTLQTDPSGHAQLTVEFGSYLAGDVKVNLL
jgi:hypothetical protein